MMDEIEQLKNITDSLRINQLEEHNVIAARILHHCIRELEDVVQGLDLHLSIKNSGGKNETF